MYGCLYVRAYVAVVDLCVVGSVCEVQFYSFGCNLVGGVCLLGSCVPEIRSSCSSWMRWVVKLSDGCWEQELGFASMDVCCPWLCRDG